MTITNETLSQISRELLGTENTSFEFTHILIGDGEFPLKNNSGPILKHIYEFPVIEVVRNKNNILLTAVIDEAAYLTIKELSLYCNYADGTKHIFSIISGIKIDKSNDLIYKLIIHVNLDINVVNTVAFPEIKVKETDYANTSDFTNVKNIYTYTVENLERMIKTNALGVGNYLNGLSEDVNENPFLPLRPYGLDSSDYGKMFELKPVGVGYNKPQTFYRFYDKLKRWKDNYNALFRYSNILNRFPKESDRLRVFDKSLLQTYGSAEVEDNGNAYVWDRHIFTIYEPEELITGSDSTLEVIGETFIANGSFYTVNVATETFIVSDRDSRIEANTYTPIDFNRWDYIVSFTTAENITDDSVVLSFCNSSQYQPMTLGVKNSKCYLEMGNKSLLRLKIPSTSQPIDFYNSLSLPSNYVEWFTSAGPFLNLHVNKTGSPTVNYADISDFSVNDYATTNNFISSAENWTFSLLFGAENTPDGTLFSYGKASSSGLKGLTISTSNGTLTVQISSDGQTVAGTLTASNLEALGTYSLELSRNGDQYTLRINGEEKDTLNLSSKIWTGATAETYVGINKANDTMTNPFNGYINLLNSKYLEEFTIIWTGACETETICTTDVSPSNTSIFYDSEKFEMLNIAFDSFFEGEILNQPLFTVKPNSKYFVKVNFDGFSYSAYYATDGITFTNVLKENIGNTINNVSNMTMGARYNALTREYINQFLGTLHLDIFDINFYYFDAEGFEKIHRQYIFTRALDGKLYPSLRDYFYVPNYSFNYMKVQDFYTDDPDYRLEILDNKIIGLKDNIKLKDENGFTLALKVFLHDLTSKTIIGKGNLDTGSFYFTFELLDKENPTDLAKIKFSYYVEEGTKISVIKEIQNEEIGSYIDYPVTFFITCTGDSSPTLQMYKNNTLILSQTLESNSVLNPSLYPIVNRVDINEDVPTEKILYDIISFSGVLSPPDIYYVNNLLDTNF